MSDFVGLETAVRPEAGQGLELGAVICKSCGEVFATLPTNGVTKIYGVCPNAACGQAIEGREGS